MSVRFNSEEENVLFFKKKKKLFGRYSTRKKINSVLLAKIIQMKIERTKLMLNKQVQNKLNWDAFKYSFHWQFELGFVASIFTPQKTDSVCSSILYLSIAVQFHKKYYAEFSLDLKSIDFSNGLQIRHYIYYEYEKWKMIPFKPFGFRKLHTIKTNKKELKKNI